MRGFLATQTQEIAKKYKQPSGVLPSQQQEDNIKKPVGGFTFPAPSLSGNITLKKTADEVARENAANMLAQGLIKDERIDRLHRYP